MSVFLHDDLYMYQPKQCTILGKKNPSTLPYILASTLILPKDGSHFKWSLYYRSWQKKNKHLRRQTHLQGGCQVGHISFGHQQTWWVQIVWILYSPGKLTEWQAGKTIIDVCRCISYPKIRRWLNFPAGLEIVFPVKLDSNNKKTDHIISSTQINSYSNI